MGSTGTTMSRETVWIITCVVAVALVPVPLLVGPSISRRRRGGSDSIHGSSTGRREGSSCLVAGISGAARTVPFLAELAGSGGPSDLPQERTKTTRLPRPHTPASSTTSLPRSSGGRGCSSGYCPGCVRRPRPETPPRKLPSESCLSSWMRMRRPSAGTDAPRDHKTDQRSSRSPLPTDHGSGPSPHPAPTPR